MARKWSIFFYRVKSLLKQVERRGGRRVGAKHFGDKLSQKLKAVLSKCFARAQLKCTPRSKGRITFIILALLGFISTQAIPAISAPRENILPVGALGKTVQISQTSEASKFVQEGMQLYQAGQIESAIERWQKAAEIYEKMGDRALKTEILLNKAAAEQGLGLYPRSYKTIVQALDLDNSGGERGGAMDLLTREAKTLNKARGLRLLGEYFQQTGKLELSSLVLQQGIEVAAALGERVEESAAIVSLGNTERAIGNKKQGQFPPITIATDVVMGQGGTVAAAIAPYKPAIEFYRQVAEERKAAPLTIVQGQLNHLSLLLEIDKYWQETTELMIDNPDRVGRELGTTSSNFIAEVIQKTKQLQMDLDDDIKGKAEALKVQIKKQLENLPASRGEVYARIKLAQHLRELKQEPRTQAGLLATARESAHNLGDGKAEAYALGNLGTLYEENEQWSDAEKVTRSAISLAPASEAPEIAYQWQWQLGRILTQKKDPEGAIAAYDAAFNTLKALRDDLAASDRNIKFSFRDSIEPLYRQYVSLLLRSQPSQKDLEKAREVLEQLQIAELDDFFGDPCSGVRDQEIEIDEIDDPAAIIYPIILEDSLEVILKLPKQKLRHYRTAISREELEAIVDQLRSQINTRPQESQSPDYLSAAQLLYDWLIGPANLESSEVETLVFVLDGPLRQIPMAVLHDGQKYLVEKYNLALTLGLKLTSAEQLQPGKIKVLAAGVSKSFPERGFPQEIGAVKKELDKIEEIFEQDAEVLREEQFTQTKLQEQLQRPKFNLVHLATHGKFSSNEDDTFLLTGDEEPGKEIINIDQLRNLLKVQDPSRAIELLVLSACQTAEGDDRAVLGLAGVAVRAGARSTIATLWGANDRATAELMGNQFYPRLAAETPRSKAQALSEAQRAVLKVQQYNHPYYWAPFILVGNWL